MPTWRTVDLPDSLCVRCRRAPRAFDRARAVGAYEGSLKAIVHAFKYDGRRSLAVPLGRLMRHRGAAVLEGSDAVIPVPLHRSRQWERGFNQATELARELGLPVVGALRRVRATPAQAALPAAQRHGNVRGAFSITCAGRKLRGLTVVLVDDVSTTSATLDACARVLKENGVAQVRALTAARTCASRVYGGKPR